MTEELTIAAPAWGDMYLRFATEEEATQALDGYTGSIDVIGTIYKQGPMMTDEEGNEYPVAEPLDGWHVNTRGPMPEALLAFAVAPTHPRRVWA